MLNEELHVAHNFLPTDLDHDGKLDVLVASFEGVSLLRRESGGRWLAPLIGSGNQTTSPSRGASEIKHGRLASHTDYLATIEPWHGFQVVVYTPPTAAANAGDALWPRQVLDEELKWGHAVWCADLDGDGDEELVIGVRDSKDAANPCGLRIYDPANPEGTRWTKHASTRPAWRSRTWPWPISTPTASPTSWPSAARLKTSASTGIRAEIDSVEPISPRSVASFILKGVAVSRRASSPLPRSPTGRSISMVRRTRVRDLRSIGRLTLALVVSCHAARLATVER